MSPFIASGRVLLLREDLGKAAASRREPGTPLELLPVLVPSGPESACPASWAFPDRVSEEMVIRLGSHCLCIQNITTGVRISGF